MLTAQCNHLKIVAIMLFRFTGVTKNLSVYYSVYLETNCRLSKWFFVLVIRDFKEYTSRLI